MVQKRLVAVERVFAALDQVGATIQRMADACHTIISSADLSQVLIRSVICVLDLCCETTLSLGTLFNGK